VPGQRVACKTAFEFTCLRTSRQRGKSHNNRAAFPPWPPGITTIVRGRHSADAARIIFPTNADEERMQTSCLSRVKPGHWTTAGGNHPAISKTDPLASILVEELVALRPVRLLVLAPVGVDLPGDVRRQLIDNAFHRKRRGVPTYPRDSTAAHSVSRAPRFRLRHRGRRKLRLPPRTLARSRSPALSATIQAITSCVLFFPSSSFFLPFFLRFLGPLLGHLDAAGLGHISEIVDGDAPHTPRGCPFQAWSLGEVLRLLHGILREEEHETPVTRPARPASKGPSNRKAAIPAADG
jgi:hypothetical protein